MARDEAAKDDMRWQGMEEGWQIDKCHLPICHWSCPMRFKGLVEANLGLWEASRGGFEKEKGGCKD